MTNGPSKQRSSLFRKYFIILSVAVVVPLTLGSLIEAFFGYRDQRAQLNLLLDARAKGAADRIEAFVGEIRDHLGWVVQLPWTDKDQERIGIDAMRLLRQAPAIASVTMVDNAGIERAFVSRRGANRLTRGADLSQSLPVVGVTASNRRTWYGPIRYQRGSEPHFTVAVIGNRRAAGIAIAEVNLKFIWDTISEIKIGDTGQAFVVDDTGRLVAHPNLSLVLRGDATTAEVVRLKQLLVATGEAQPAINIESKNVIAIAKPIESLGWTVIAEQPAVEALQPIKLSLLRSALLVLTGVAASLGMAYLLARRMSGPIKALGAGAEQIGSGQFGYRVKVSTGDELETLADRFNQMAAELALSKDKSERIGRLKRFLAPQIAELVENSASNLLDDHRREVVVIFGDLRGFTAFSAQADPSEIMTVLTQYFEVIGRSIVRHEATQTSFTGDGFMLLLNAPVECEEPAVKGIRLAMEMQESVQVLVKNWNQQGYNIGFGLGVAMGRATVGTIGYEGRQEYTAIGSAVNLASRLCSIAANGEILVDEVVMANATPAFSFLGPHERHIKGYSETVVTYVVAPPKTSSLSAA